MFDFVDTDRVLFDFYHATLPGPEGQLALVRRTLRVSEMAPLWIWIVAVAVLAWGTLHYRSKPKVSLARAALHGTLASGLWMGAVTLIRSFL
jgi:hypothetical protein